jgi:hypothetical protein
LTRNQRISIVGTGEAAVSFAESLPEFGVVAEVFDACDKGASGSPGLVSELLNGSLDGAVGAIQATMIESRTDQCVAGRQANPPKSSEAMAQPDSIAVVNCGRVPLRVQHTTRPMHAIMPT